MNAAWHLAHPMPKKPSAKQRLVWHLAHQRHCDCRELKPAQLAKLRVEAKKPGAPAKAAAKFRPSRAGA